jgi:hypothetical protein
MSKKLSRELIAQKVKSDRIESIRNLNLWGSNIEDISIIEEMPSLEIVSLSVNKIRTLRPFANLSNLKELYLRRNLITNLNEIKYLADCQNLTVLWLSENPICDNPNYRAVVICVLPQLQKLDDIAITDEEREKADKKLSGNYDEEDEGETNFEENNNVLQQKEERFSPKKKNVNENMNKDIFSKKKSFGYNEQNEYENEDSYYGNNNNKIRKSQIQRNKNSNSKAYDERQEEEDEEYIKPKKTFQPNRNKYEEYGKYNKNENDIYNYDERPIRANSGMVPKNNNFKRNNNRNTYEDNNYENNNNDKKKKGNSNILNCVISLLKELSPNELQIVKREIDRINNY